MKKYLLYVIIFFYSSALYSQNPQQLIKNSKQLYKQGSIKEALKLLFYADSILKAQNNKKELYNTLNLELKYAEKLKDFTLTYKIVRELGTIDNKEHNAKLAYITAQIAYENKDYNNAIKIAEYAFNIAVELNNFELIENITSALELYYKAIGNTKKANLYKEISYHYKIKSFEQALDIKQQIINNQRRELQRNNFYILENKYQIIITRDSLALLKEIQKKKNALLTALYANQRLTEYFLETKRNQLKERQRIILLLSIAIFIISLLFALYLRLYQERKRNLERLKKMNQELNKKNQELSEKNITIQKQKEQLQKFATEIKASMNYARTLQFSILPNTNDLKHFFTDYFVFFKPKDIVSGDFFWTAKIGKYAYIAEVDCTGHGIPAALISILAYIMLNQILYSEKILNPSQILVRLNEKIEEYINSEITEHTFINDGLEITLLRTDKEQVVIASANQYAIAFINDEFHLIEGSLFAIGQKIINQKPTFNEYTLTLKENNLFYLFSDGFISQLNPKGRKYILKNFINLIKKIHSEPFNKQKQIIEKEFNTWKGSNRQMDDVLIIGIKI